MIPGSPGEGGPDSKEGTLVKGFSPLHLRHFVRLRFGEQVWEEILVDLKPESKEILSGRLSTSGWYPYRAYVEALEIVVKRCLGGDVKKVRQFGAYDLQTSITNVDRTLYKVGSPSFIVRTSSLLWRSYLDTGRLVVETSGPGFAAVRIEEFVPPSEACCWYILGSISRGLELSGASSVEVFHMDCPLNGNRFMRYQACWIEDA